MQKIAALRAARFRALIMSPPKIGYLAKKASSYPARIDGTSHSKFAGAGVWSDKKEGEMPAG